MNFISTFEELNKLYEEVIPEEDISVEDAPIEEACVKEELTEAADEEIEIVDDETPIDEVPEEESVEDDEPKQVVIECTKCGALVIKSEADIVVDEESGLVNVEDKCAFCEETEGYKIIGTMIPYEDAEVEETEVSEVEDTESADVDEEVFNEAVESDTEPNPSTAAGPLSETLQLGSHSKQLNALATSIHKAFVSAKLDDSITVSTVNASDEFGSGGHITISTADKLSDKNLETIKLFSLKYLKLAGAEAENVKTTYSNGIYYVILSLGTFSVQGMTPS